MHAPTQANILQLKTLLKYLRGSAHYKLNYYRDNHPLKDTLNKYADKDRDLISLLALQKSDWLNLISATGGARRDRRAKKSCRRLPGTTTHPQGHANTDLVARSGRDLRKTTTRGPGWTVNGALGLVRATCRVVLELE